MEHISFLDFPYILSDGTALPFLPESNEMTALILSRLLLVLFLLFEKEDGEEGGGEAVIDGVAGHGCGLGEEQGGDTDRHCEKDGSGLESAWTPQGET